MTSDRGFHGRRIVGTDGPDGSRHPGLRGRSTEEIVALALCAIGVCGAAPFLVARLATAEYVVAAVDAVLLGGILVVAGLIWFTRRIRVLSIVLTVFYLSVMVAVIHLKGVAVFGWAYPTITASFFLVRPRLALGLSAAALAAILPVVVAESPALDAATMIMTLVLTTLFAFVFASQTHRQRSSLHEQARRDPLTDAGNRRALEDTLRGLIDLRARGAATASLILLDIDHFKAINDEYGHEVGDQVLVELVGLIATRVRRTDALFRLGGEEFVIVANGADAALSLRLADELRQLVERTRFTSANLALTVSMGLAEARVGDEPAQWLNRADVALYEAKNAGRNAARTHDVRATAPA